MEPKSFSFGPPALFETPTSIIGLSYVTDIGGEAMLCGSDIYVRGVVMADAHILGSENYLPSTPIVTK
jgi:hypothetical protein